MLLFFCVFQLFSTPTGVESSYVFDVDFSSYDSFVSAFSLHVFLSLSLSLPCSECRTVASNSLKHKIIPIGAINCELVEDYIYAWECVCVWVFVCMARVPAHIQPTHCHTPFLHIPLIFITLVTKHSEQSFKRILMLDQKNYMDHWGFAFDSIITLRHEITNESKKRRFVLEIQLFKGTVDPK